MGGPARPPFFLMSILRRRPPAIYYIYEIYVNPYQQGRGLPARSVRGVKE
jgi:hypothetical protein